MGLTEAGKYIRDLHKKQSNPYLWPDYLTGLPDKAAIINKLDEIFPKLGEYSISYVRIANIQPYLLKYGTNKHVEIIQWAAAILKTGLDEIPHSFVGALNTHDFIAIYKTKNRAKFFERTLDIFRKKASTYYSKKDLAKGTAISYDGNDGKTVNIGLMKFIVVVADKKLMVKRSHIIQNMTRICGALEGSEKEIIVLDNGMLQKD